MAHFITDTVLKTRRGVRLKSKPFELYKDLLYFTDILTRHIICVVRGYRTDLASIPRLTRWAFSVAGKWRDAAIVHDFCCHPRDIGGVPIIRFCNTEESSAIFKEAMICCGVRKRIASLLSWSVNKYGPQFEKGDTWTPKQDYRIDKESGTSVAYTQDKS